MTPASPDGHGDKTYYLHARTSGFQDKVTYFELYEGKPVFDACNYSNNNLLYFIDFNNYPEYPDKSIKQRVKSLHLNLDNPEKLKIIYTQNKDEGFSGSYSVKFSDKAD